MPRSHQIPLSAHPALIAAIEAEPRMVCVTPRPVQVRGLCAFEDVDWTHVARHVIADGIVTESDRRQIKPTGAAREEARTSPDNCCARPSDAAPPTQERVRFKKGDVIRFRPHLFEPGQVLDMECLQKLRDETYVFSHVEKGSVYAEHCGRVSNISCVDHLEPLPAPVAAPAEGGWISYSGRRCPLPIGTHFEYRCLNGETGVFVVMPSAFSKSSFWNHDPEDSEEAQKGWLVAYRPTAVKD